MGLSEDTVKNFPRQKSVDYERWEDAQIQSEKAAQLTANFEKAIFPLDKTKTKSVLDNMWKSITQVSVLPKWFLARAMMLTHQYRIISKSVGSLLTFCGDSREHIIVYPNGTLV